MVENSYSDIVCMGPSTRYIPSALGHGSVPVGPGNAQLAWTDSKKVVLKYKKDLLLRFCTVCEKMQSEHHAQNGRFSASSHL